MREQAIDAFIAGMSIADAVKMGGFPSDYSFNIVISQLRRRGANIPKVRSGSWKHFSVDESDTKVNENGRRCYSDEVRSRAIQLRAEGLSYPQIIKAVGVGSTRTVMDWVLEHDKKCT